MTMHHLPFTIDAPEQLGNAQRHRYGFGTVTHFHLGALKAGPESHIAG